MDVTTGSEPSSAGTARHIDVDVLVVGAGPTGLTAACEAIRHGLSVRVIDRKPSRSTFSKALVVHARTLEMFESMGVAEAIVAEGQPFAALNIHAGRRRRPVRVDLMELPWGDTAYPFWLSIPQYATERILEAHLNKLGGEVEWEISLDELRDEGDHVQARLKRADGGEDIVRSRWLVGCDGGRSRVREQVGLHLDRVDARATFILADVKTTADLTAEDEGHVFLGPDGLLLIVPMPEPRRWRIIAHVPAPSPDSPIAIDAAFLDDLIRRRTGIEFGSHDVVWQSQFNLRHGLADHYRQGRVFLAGDAAHVHSPVGGQGLNTGVQDAHNLLWKLGVAQRAGAVRTKELLDSYEAERRPVAQAMVRGTTRATGALTASGLLRALLSSIAPRIIARPAVQARLGRAVGMLEVGYPESPLTNSAHTSAGAGRRMPNPQLSTGDRLYQELDPTRHTWVVRGRPGEAPPDPHAPQWAGLPMVFIDDTVPDDGAGTLAPVVLVRPDRYVAGAGETVESVRSQLAVQPEQMPVPR